MNGRNLARNGRFVTNHTDEIEPTKDHHGTTSGKNRHNSQTEFRMSRSRATYNANALFLAAAVLITTVIAIVLTAPPASAAQPVSAAQSSTLKKKVVDTTTSIYRCTFNDGSTAYSDIRCKGARQVERWKAEKLAPGITASRAMPLNDMLDQNADSAPTQKDDPYVACRKIGGKWFVAARLCKLAPEARIRMSFE